MVEIYDPGELVRPLRTRPQDKPLSGRIISVREWAEGTFTYGVEVETAGGVLTLPRVQEAVSWWYQSGAGLRPIGQQVLVARVSRTRWEIVGDDPSTPVWENERPRAYLENHALTRDADGKRILTAYIEVTPEQGVIIRGGDLDSYHVLELLFSRMQIRQVFTDENEDTYIPITTSADKELTLTGGAGDTRHSIEITEDAVTVEREQGGGSTFYPVVSDSTAPFPTTIQANIRRRSVRVPEGGGSVSVVDSVSINLPALLKAANIKIVGADT